MASDEWRARALGHLDVAYRVARLLTRTDAAAEDLVQDAYLRLFERREQVGVGTSARAQLVATLHTLARRRLGEPERGRADAAPQIPRRLAVEQVHEREIAQALRALRADERLALWLRDAEQLAYEEIADALDVSVADVRETIAAARARFAADLAAYAAAHRWTRTAP